MNEVAKPHAPAPARKSPRASKQTGLKMTKSSDKIIVSVHDDKYLREAVPYAESPARPKQSAVPTVASAAHAVATARCNRIVRDAAPWWLRSGAHDASSILILHLKEIYEQLKSTSVDDEMRREELAKLRDALCAAEAAGSAMAQGSVQASLALKAVKLGTEDLENRLQREVDRRERAEAIAASAEANRDAAVLRQEVLQCRHDQIRDACDQAYQQICRCRKKEVLTQLKMLAFQQDREAICKALEDRALQAEVEAARRDSVDDVNTALVAEITLLHVELHKLRTELTRNKGNPDALVFKTDNDPLKFRPRITAVSVLPRVGHSFRLSVQTCLSFLFMAAFGTSWCKLCSSHKIHSTQIMTNMYKKSKKLERRNTPDTAHNEKLMARLEELGVSPPKSDQAKIHDFVDQSHPNLRSSAATTPKQTTAPKPSRESPSQQSTPRPTSALNKLKDTAGGPGGSQMQTQTTKTSNPTRREPPCADSNAALQTSSQSSTSSRQKVTWKSKPLVKSSQSSFRSHVIRPKDKQAEERANALQRRLNYQPTFSERELLLAATRSATKPRKNAAPS